MSDSTTIRVDRTTHEELRRLAERDQVTVTETVARAVRALRQDEMGRQLAGELAGRERVA
jgi:predicted transcriptional regulator